MSLHLVFTHILPVVALYYMSAVLVIIPGTSNIRLVLLPLSLWSAFRAVTSIDIALAWNEPGFRCLDFGFGVRRMSRTYPKHFNAFIAKYDHNINACHRMDNFFTSITAS